MAEMRSHANLIEDIEEIGYHIDGPVRIDRTVFWGDNILFGRNTVEAGAHVAPHTHPHEQYSLIVEGECDIRCGDEKFHLTPGGICFAPSNVEHELWMWEESDVVIIDIFNPVRQDWIDPLDEK